MCRKNAGTAPPAHPTRAKASACRSSRAARKARCFSCSPAARETKVRLSQRLHIVRLHLAPEAIAEILADIIRHIGDLLVGEMAAEGRHAFVAVEHHGDDIT